MIFTRRRARTACFMVLSILAFQPLYAQQKLAGPGSANYRLASRLAPYKLDKLIYSTNVDPRWIEGTDKFWYEWKSSRGSTYYIVDPAARSRRTLFDNDRLAAELTRITRDPWDGQHLPIRSIRFINDRTLQFEVQSSEDEEQKGDTTLNQERQDKARGTARPKPKKKVYHFEYDVVTQTLRELKDYEAPDNHAPWASVSPDGKVVVYAKNGDLYMMTSEEYEKILAARRGKARAAPGAPQIEPRDTEADSAEWKVQVAETRLTTDGEPDYSYALPDFGMIDREKLAHKDRRKRARIIWAPDSRHFAVQRDDERKVGNLWVIHNVGKKRPELETYKYEMPGEKDVPQEEFWIYDLNTKSKVKVHYPNAWQDETLAAPTARQFIYQDSDKPRGALATAQNWRDS